MLLEVVCSPNRYFSMHSVLINLYMVAIKQCFKLRTHEKTKFLLCKQLISCLFWFCGDDCSLLSSILLFKYIFI